MNLESSMGAALRARITHREEYRLKTVSAMLGVNVSEAVRLAVVDFVDAFGPGRPVAEVLRDISPIEDFTGQLKLELSDHIFDPPKYSEDECRERDMTYARPLFVTARFMNAGTGEIKEQTVFMGDFPMMTDRGTFIINGTERIVVSQLVRSPGVYFGINPDKTSPEKDVVDAKMIPGRGAWLEFEVDKKDIVYVRIDRKRKQPVTVLLKALGFGDTPEELANLAARFLVCEPRREQGHGAEPDQSAAGACAQERNQNRKQATRPEDPGRKRRGQMRGVAP